MSEWGRERKKYEGAKNFIDWQTDIVLTSKTTVMDKNKSSCSKNVLTFEDHVTLNPIQWKALNVITG